MYRSKVLIGNVLLCYLLFTIFEFCGCKTGAYYFHSLIVPLITLMYWFAIEKRSRLFFWFLLCYSVSDVIGLLLFVVPLENEQKLYDFEYYLGNLLYIFSYLFLVIKISESLNFRDLLAYFKTHVIALLVLYVYLVFVLQGLIEDKLYEESDYYFELIYNIVSIALLPISLLNYLYNDNKKALMLFGGSLCIVFSEIIDVAHIYVLDFRVLNFLSTTFALIAFYLFYQQSKLINAPNREHFESTL